MQIALDSAKGNESETSISSEPEDEVGIQLFMRIVNLLTDLFCQPKGAGNNKKHKIVDAHQREVCYFCPCSM